MYYKHFFFYIALVMMISLSCEKQTLPSDCQKLKDGITTNEYEKVKTVILHFINRMPSKDYTHQNLNNLAASLSNQCDITAEVLCFDCIKTLPSQSEMRLSFFSSGSLLSKTIDISYTPDKKMDVVNMHD